MSTDLTPKDLLPFFSVAESMRDENPLDTGMPHDRAIYPKTENLDIAPNPPFPKKSQGKPPSARFLGPESALVRALIHSLGSLAPADHIRMVVQGFCEEESVPKRHTEATLAYIDSTFLSEDNDNEYGEEKAEDSSPAPGGCQSVLVDLGPEKSTDHILSEFAWSLLLNNLKPTFLFHRETVAGQDILWVTTGVYNTHIDGDPTLVNWNGRDSNSQTINKSGKLVRNQNGNRVEQSDRLPGNPDSCVYMWALRYDVGDKYIFWVNHKKGGVSRDVKKICVTLTANGPVVTPALDTKDPR